MSRGDDRADYLANVCPGEPLWFERDDEDKWQVVVDEETGVAFSMFLSNGYALPRYELAAMLDDGFEP